MQILNVPNDCSANLLQPTCFELRVSYERRVMAQQHVPKVVSRSLAYASWLFTQ